jgi:hypothetical protein
VAMAPECQEVTMVGSLGRDREMGCAAEGGSVGSPTLFLRERVVGCTGFTLTPPFPWEGEGAEASPIVGAAGAPSARGGGGDGL